MPLYEYRCKQCGHRFEKIQSFSAPEEKECPVCKGEVERLISAPAVQFKGSGFYSTDYVSRPAAAKSSEGGAGDSAASSDGKAAPSAASGDGGSKSSSESSAPATPKASTSKE